MNIKILQIDISKNRIFGLDLLRMFAIMYVLFEHSATFFPQKLFHILNYLYIDGVVIFFVLSGFLIGSILIKNIEREGFNKKSLFDFWIRRWFRTLPNYYLFLIIMAVFSKIFLKGFPLKMVPEYFFFTQNLFNGIERGFYGESWSLCVEEWFYILIPVLLFLCLKILKVKFSKLLLILVISILMCSTLLRFILFELEIISKMNDYSRVVMLRLDNIMYGVLAAYIHFYKNLYWYKYRNISFTIGIFLLIVWRVLYYTYADFQSFFHVNIFYPLLCTAIALLLPYLNSLKVKKFNAFSVSITYISLISYSLYLVHYSFLKKIVMDNILFLNSENNLQTLILKNLFYWITPILISILIYKYFELPLTNLRERIKPELVLSFLKSKFKF